MQASNMKFSAILADRIASDRKSGMDQYVDL